MSRPLWTFWAYLTPAGGQIVQEWYDEQPEEVQYEVYDSLAYLQNLPNHLWKRPHFDTLGGQGISEIRFKVDGSTYRIYGDFGPERSQYTALAGTDKKVNNQRHVKGEAVKRNKKIQRGEAGVHEF